MTTNQETKETGSITYGLPWFARQECEESGRAVVVLALLSVFFGYERISRLTEADQNRLFFALREGLLEKSDEPA